MKDKGVLIENEVIAEILQKKTEAEILGETTPQEPQKKEIKPKKNSPKEKKIENPESPSINIEKSQVYRESSGSSYFRLKVITNRSHSSPKEQTTNTNPVFIDLAKEGPTVKKKISKKKDNIGLIEKPVLKKHGSLSNLIKESFHEYKEFRKVDEGPVKKSSKRRKSGRRKANSLSRKKALNEAGDLLHIPEPPKNSLINSRDEFVPFVQDKSFEKFKMKNFKKKPKKIKKKKKIKILMENPSMKKLVDGIKQKVENINISPDPWGYYDMRNFKRKEKKRGESGKGRRKKTTNFSKKIRQVGKIMGLKSSFKKRRKSRSNSSRKRRRKNEKERVFKLKKPKKRKEEKNLIEIQDLDMDAPCNTPEEGEKMNVKEFKIEDRERIMEPKFEEKPNSRRSSKEKKKKQENYRENENTGKIKGRKTVVEEKKRGRRRNDAEKVRKRREVRKDEVRMEKIKVEKVGVGKKKHVKLEVLKMVEKKEIKVEKQGGEIKEEKIVKEEKIFEIESKLIVREEEKQENTVEEEIKKEVPKIELIQGNEDPQEEEEVGDEIEEEVYDEIEIIQVNEDPQEEEVGEENSVKNIEEKIEEKVTQEEIEKEVVEDNFKEEIEKQIEENFEEEIEKEQIEVEESEEVIKVEELEEVIIEAEEEKTLLIPIQPKITEADEFSFSRPNYVILERIEPKIITITTASYKRPKIRVYIAPKSQEIQEIKFYSLLPIYPSMAQFDQCYIARVIPKIDLIPIKPQIKEDEKFKIFKPVKMIKIPNLIICRENFQIMKKVEISQKINPLIISKENFTILKKIPLIPIQPCIQDSESIYHTKAIQPPKIHQKIFEEEKFKIEKIQSRPNIPPAIEEFTQYYHCLKFTSKSINCEVIEIDVLSNFPIQKRPKTYQYIKEQDNCSIHSKVKNIPIYPKIISREIFDYKGKEELAKEHEKLIKENETTVLKVLGSFMKWSPFGKVVKKKIERRVVSPNLKVEEKKKDYTYKPDSVLSSDSDDDDSSDSSDEKKSDYKFNTPMKKEEFRKSIMKRNQGKTPSIIISNYAVDEVANTDDFGLSPDPKEEEGNEEQSGTLKTSKYSKASLKVHKNKKEADDGSWLSKRPKIPKIDIMVSDKKSHLEKEIKRNSVKELSVMLMEPQIHPKYTPRKSRIDFTGGFDVNNFKGGLLDSQRSKMSKVSLSVGSLHYGKDGSERGSHLGDEDLEMINSDLGGSDMSLIDDHDLEAFGTGVPGNLSGESMSQSLRSFKFHENENSGEKSKEEEKINPETDKEEIGEKVQEPDEEIISTRVEYTAPTNDLSEFMLSKLEIKTEIKNSYLMSTDSRPALEHLINKSNVLNLRKGDILSSKSKPLDSLHLVYEGKLRYHKNKEEDHLFEYRRGDLIGVINCIFGDDGNQGETFIEVMEDDTILISIHKDQLGDKYLELLKKKVEIGLQMLALFDITENMEDEFKMVVMNKVKLEGFKEDEYIIKEGEEAEYLYLLFDGSAEVYKKTEDDPDGDSFMIKYYDEGTWFGELAILRNCRRTASVRAVSDCNLLALHAQSVLRFKEQFQEGFENQFYMYDDDES